jgi:hypothetical protein
VGLVRITFGDKSFCFFDERVPKAQAILRSSFVP